MRIWIIVFLFFSRISYCQKERDVDEHYVAPYIYSYTDFRHSLKTDTSYFKQEKLLVGINFRINENWSGQVRLDVIRYDNKQNPNRLTPYIKPGNITYKKGKFTVDGGILLSSQMNDQLKKWENRYIYRTFQDKQSFGWTNDLGIRTQYKVSPDFIVEAGILNGKGYRNLSLSFPLKYTGAIIFSPNEKLFFKAYTDTYKKNIPQSTLATLFDCRKEGKYSFSFEYNYKWNYNFVAGENRYGISLYSTIHFFENFAFISRLDKLYIKSPKTDFNNLESINNNLYLLGLQYQPLKQVRIAVDYQVCSYYKDINKDDTWLNLHLEYRMM